MPKPKKPQQRKSKRATKTATELEVFTFEIETWTINYDLSIAIPDGRSPNAKLIEELQGIPIEGPLVSPTKRKIERVHLDLYAREGDLRTWEGPLSSVGIVASVKGGLLTAAAWVPAASCPTLLLGLSFGKVQGAELQVEGLRRGNGVVSRISTIGDLDDWFSEHHGGSNRSTAISSFRRG